MEPVATTDIDIIRARVDKHGRILDEHGRAIDGLALVVLGDSQKHVRGLLQRTDDLEKLTQEVRDWRRDMATAYRMGMVYARIAVALLTATGLAAWREPLGALLKALTGG